jgi:predicted DNA-binding WGR domain protein
MATKTFINKTKQSNKFWEYTVNGNSVTVAYGRVGRAPQDKTHNFSSSYERDAFISKIVQSKIKKGYVESTAKELKEEAVTARQLGTQYKISRMLFVGQKGRKLTRINNYDPKKYVYVEILNSWKKDITRLLLSKTESFIISGGVTEAGRTITYGNKSNTSGSFVNAVRGVLRRLSEQLVEVVKTVKFAAMGARKLFDDDEDEDQSPEYANSMALVLDQVDCSGFDSKVVSRFASMGARVLEL